MAVAQIACEVGNVAANCSSLQPVAQVQEPFGRRGKGTK